MAALNDDILNNYGSTETHSLSNLLNDPESTESIGPLVQDSPYIDCESLEQFFTPLIDTFSVMSLNAQSLNAKYDSLRTFLSQLLTSDFSFSAICLQETWVQSSEGYSLLSIPDYNIIPYASTVSSHSGLVTYLHKQYNFEQRHFLTHPETV